MEIIRIAALAAAAALAAGALAGCGKKNDDGSSAAQTVTAPSADSEQESLPDEISQPDHTSIDLSKSGKPAVTEAAVSGVFEDGSLSDIYGVEGDDKRFTEEAGLYGSPVRFESSDFGAGVLSFKYDPEQLRGVPPENLRILHYNEAGDGMEYITALLDGESCELSAPINETGVYIIVDDYARKVTLGQDVSGLIIPDPQDELYDGEIPYYAESRPFTVTIPIGCYGYESIADIDADGFSYHTFFHIVETHSAFVWVDISYITPDEEMSFKDFSKKIREQLPLLSVGGEIPKRTVDTFKDITSPDGTEGIYVNCKDVYAPSGINPELTYRTLCYYYPDAEGGFYEIRAQFLDNPYDPDRDTNRISESILKSFTLKDGAGRRGEEPEPKEEESSSESGEESRDDTLVGFFGEG